MDKKRDNLEAAVTLFCSPCTRWLLASAVLLLGGSFPASGGIDSEIFVDSFEEEQACGSNRAPSGIILDADNDCIGDLHEGAETLQDTDDDDIPDYLDPDSDGDGILDFHEAGDQRLSTRPLDSDLDGLPDFRDLDSDADGYADTLEAGDLELQTPPVDTDQLGQPDFLDNDSDQDGLPDISEIDCDQQQGRLLADTDMDGSGDLAEFALGADRCLDTSTAWDFAELHFVLAMDGAEQNAPLIFGPRIHKADIFFSMDTTGSMAGEIANLQDGLQSLMSDVGARIADVGFGVGGYEDFPVAPYGAPGDTPFILYQGVVTDTRIATDAVNALTLHNGGDFPEAGYEALFQIANGSGINGTAGTFGPFSVPGRVGGGQFRVGSAPLIIQITDAVSHDPTMPVLSGMIAAYPASFNAHMGTMAESALAAINARVITVQSLLGSPYEEYEQAAETQLMQISAASRAVVPVCAFKTSDFNWRCGVNTCCGGTIPDGQGGCVLRFTINGNGAGLNDSIIDGLSALVKYGTHAYYAYSRDDGNLDPIDTSRFLSRIEAQSFFRPPSEPERSCVPEPVPMAAQGFGYPDGFDQVASGAATILDEGSMLQFNVVANNDFLEEGDQPQVFIAPVDLIELPGSTVNETQEIVIIIPARSEG